MRALAETGAALLGGELCRAAPLGGGDLAEIVRITLADGRDAVVKNGPAPRIEAAMLEAIAAAGAPAPKVLAVNDAALVLEVRPASGSVGDAWDDLGAVLAILHRTTGARYGWDSDYAFGPVAIDNRWSDDWPSFWAERRLLVHLRHLPPALARRIEALAADLKNRLPAHPAASLLHGDLWSGNILADGGRVTALIDPASYYGHGEVDLAMLRLFGRPSAGFFDAYGPLTPGHEHRLPVYSLWPALVHFRLFGDSYRSMAERFLSATGA